MRYIYEYNGSFVKLSVKAGMSFGFFFFAIFFGYSYAFLLGGIWVDNEFWNDTFDRPYNSGDIISIFFGIFFGMMALAHVGPNIGAFAQAKAAGAKVFDIIDRTPQILLDDENAKQHDMKGEIAFKNVDFFYPSRSDQKVLDNFTWTFEKGKTTAIVGPSGSGKSTIVQLIERFYDVSAGDITIDGENIKGLKLASLRKQIGYVGQEPVLFNTSIKENIQLGRSDATDTEIQAALMSTNAWGFVSELPEGMDTQTGAGGSQLSGGEKQRIALSRAFIKMPRLLIFDEATSALDKKNE